LAEAEDKEEDMESPNSCGIVEAGLDEIPPTLAFDPQMFQVEDMESPNSRMVVEVGLDEIPSTLGVNSRVPHSPPTKVSLFHVIFNINGALSATCFE
jgi:hypothetical protein